MATKSGVPYDPNMTPEVRAYIEKTRRLTKQEVIKTFDNITVTNTATINNVDAQTVSAPSILRSGKSVLTIAGAQELEAGFTNRFVSHGQGTGLVSINVADGYFQDIINNNTSFTLRAVEAVGCCILHVRNGGNPGIITFNASFVKKYPGPDLTRVPGARFAISIFSFGPFGTDYAVQPRQ